ncbi:MAG: hypothetical protein PHD32_04825 [Eubacteriales bacterium]|nr:hypothetical protein [Eubacteriales bacterium]
MEKLFLGFAQRDITPSGSVQTIGFGKADPFSRGVMDPLAAQASVWRQGDFLCCLIAVDHIGFSARHCAQLRGEIARLLRITPAQVMLCFSHTHAAPNDALEQSWFAFAAEKICQAVREAAQQCVPVDAV